MSYFAQNTGFSDEDMEKPKFTFSADGAKVPFILSKDGEHPVIQVCLGMYIRPENMCYQLP